MENNNLTNASNNSNNAALSFKEKVNVIAIDGPAGSGKSTIAKLLSKRLGLNYIDTGATYRTITLLALKNNLKLDDEKSILNLAKKSKIEIECKPLNEMDYTKVKLNGEDVTEEIRSSQVGKAVSIVSKLSGVRKFLVEFQRNLAKNGPSVLEGRDIGTVVFPNAILKIYLTAKNEERIKRRLIQQKEKGDIASIDKIKDEIETRDKIDSTREDSPLKIPEDAVVIDNTNLTIEETYQIIKKIYDERIQSNS